jgi:hypothetical protein
VQTAPFLVMQLAPAAAYGDVAGPAVTSNQLLQGPPAAALTDAGRAAYLLQQQQQQLGDDGMRVERLLRWAYQQMQQQGRQQQLPDRVRLSQLVATAITHGSSTATASCMLQLYMVGSADPSAATTAAAAEAAAPAAGTDAEPALAATHSADVEVQGFVLDAPVVTKALAAAQFTNADASSGASSSSAAAASAAAAAGSSYYLGSLTPEQQQQQGVAAVAASLAVVQHPDGSVALLTDLPGHLTVQQAAAAAVLPGSEIWDASDMQLQRRLAAVDAELSLRLAAACAMPSGLGSVASSGTPAAASSSAGNSASPVTPAASSSSSRAGAGLQSAAGACRSIRGSGVVAESGEKGGSSGLEVGDGVGCSNISRVHDGGSAVGEGSTSVGDSAGCQRGDGRGRVGQQQQLHQPQDGAASAGLELATAQAATAASDTEGSFAAKAGDPATATAVAPAATAAAGAAVTAPAAEAAEDFAERLRRLDAAYTQAMQQRLAEGGGGH